MIFPLPIRITVAPQIAIAATSSGWRSENGTARAGLRECEIDRISFRTSATSVISSVVRASRLMSFGSVAPKPGGSTSASGSVWLKSAMTTAGSTPNGNHISLLIVVPALQLDPNETTEPLRILLNGGCRVQSPDRRQRWPHHAAGPRPCTRFGTPDPCTLLTTLQTARNPRTSDVHTPYPEPAGPATLSRASSDGPRTCPIGQFVWSRARTLPHEVCRRRGRPLDRTLNLSHRKLELPPQGAPRRAHRVTRERDHPAACAINVTAMSTGIGL